MEKPGQPIPGLSPEQRLQRTKKRKLSADAQEFSPERDRHVPRELSTPDSLKQAQMEWRRVQTGHRRLHSSTVGSLFNRFGASIGAILKWDERECARACAFVLDEVIGDDLAAASPLTEYDLSRMASFLKQAAFQGFGSREQLRRACLRLCELIVAAGVDGLSQSRTIGTLSACLRQALRGHPVVLDTSKAVREAFRVLAGAMIGGAMADANSLSVCNAFACLKAGLDTPGLRLAELPEMQVAFDPLVQRLASGELVPALPIEISNDLLGLKALLDARLGRQRDWPRLHAAYQVTVTWIAEGRMEHADADAIGNVMSSLKAGLEASPPLLEPTRELQAAFEILVGKIAAGAMADAHEVQVANAFSGLKAALDLRSTAAAVPAYLIQAGYRQACMHVVKYWADGADPLAITNAVGSICKAWQVGALQSQDESELLEAIRTLLSGIRSAVLPNGDLFLIGRSAATLLTICKQDVRYLELAWDLAGDCLHAFSRDTAPVAFDRWRMASRCVDEAGRLLAALRAPEWQGGRARGAERTTELREWIIQLINATFDARPSRLHDHEVETKMDALSRSLNLLLRSESTARTGDADRFCERIGRRIDELEDRLRELHDASE